MSRTKKDSKSPGSEHWSRRPKSYKDDKNLTVRAERKLSGEEIIKALKEIYKEAIEQNTKGKNK